MIWEHGPSQLAGNGFPLAADHLKRHFMQQSRISQSWMFCLETNAIICRSLFYMATATERKFPELENVLGEMEMNPSGYPDNFHLIRPKVKDLDCELWRKAKEIGVNDSHLLRQFQSRFAAISQ